MVRKLIQSLKIATGAIGAIIVADFCGLQFASTAGIITVLSIQNTKRETLSTAKNRTIAFICALIIAGMCYFIWGFGIMAFSVYLFLFALLCLIFRWPEAIAMDSVLISHFLLEKAFTLPVIINEVSLFVIGTAFGILLNLHLKKKVRVFSEMSALVDDEIREILHHMAEYLERGEKESYRADWFKTLEEKIADTKEIALENWNNTLWNNSEYEINYIKMRENQSRILKNMYRSINMLSSLPAQTKRISEFITEVEKEFHRDNNVVNLLTELITLQEKMKQDELPQSRDEFEARAVLYYMMKQLEEFLTLKREFIIKNQGG